MRKIIVFSMITLDGVMQGPGSPEEDTEDGFTNGGWVAPYGDEAYDQAVAEELKPADYLLGRKTFDIWAAYWPTHGEIWPHINEGTKYVLSNTLENSDWNNSVFIKNVEDIKKIKNQPSAKGYDLHVWGSSELVQLLLEHDLVDELWLKIHPLLLGKGKKLFSNNAAPAAYTVTNSVITSTGVVMARYKREGKVTTGTVGG